jgi:hypothetical protein
LLTSSDLLQQLVSDRQQDLLGSAATRRNVVPGPVRTRIARTLRRAADRLDAATAATGSMSGADPGRGQPAS